MIEPGLNSFGEVATDGGRAMSDAETVRLLVEEARLAESAGLDVFSVGEHYLSEVDTGALFVGSPETVARKIAAVARDLRLSRFDLKYDNMHLPRAARARTIELLGREVAPRARELLAKEPSHV